MTTYHTAHLTPDPARRRLGHGRASSCAARATGCSRPRARRRLLRLDQQRPRGATGRRRHLAGSAAFAAPGVEAVVLDASVGLQSLGAVVRRRAGVEFPGALLARRRGVGRGRRRTLLRPGGRFVIVQPNFRYAWRQYFRRLHAPVGLHRRLAAGDAARAGLSRPGGPAEVPAVFDARSARADHAVAGERVSRSPIKPMAGQMLVVAARD